MSNRVRCITCHRLMALGEPKVVVRGQWMCPECAYHLARKNLTNA